MEITSLIDKALKPIEQYSGLIGAGANAYTRLDKWTDTIARLTNPSAGAIHAPNWRGALETWINGTGLAALIASFVGMIGADATNNAMLKSLFSALQKGGMGWTVAEAAFDLAYYTCHSPSPNSGGSGNPAPSGYGY